MTPNKVFAGKAIILSAPSGSGKTTIARSLLANNSKLQFSISACTRNPRKGKEKDGIDYYFISEAEFKDKINQGEFIEWEEVYSGMFYGTLKSEVEKIWKRGNHVLFDVDVQGGVNLKKYFGNKALAIFIKAPSLAEIERRLSERQTENKQTLNLRLEKVKHELTFEKEFDVTVVNSSLEQAIAETKSKVDKFLSA